MTAVDFHEARALLKAYDESKHPRGEHGRWTFASDAVVVRGARIAMHSAIAYQHARDAANAASVDAAMPHLLRATDHINETIMHLRRLPAEARELRAETMRKLQRARAFLVRVRARLARTQREQAA